MHTPVLTRSLLSLLEFGDDAIVVDATLGQAGHALELGGRLSEAGLLICLDVDQVAVAQSGQRLANLKCRRQLVCENFGRLDVVLKTLGVDHVDVILADLGVSSAQLIDPDCGISFQTDSPLDMRLDKRLTRTAADIVNRLDEKELANLIFQYGEERKSRRIAREIVAARKVKKIHRTGRLVEIINRAMGYRGGPRRSKIHPATRTFQALRIAVNDELGNLEKLLQLAPDLLNENGQIAVISFHSLEDRLVKNSFRDNKIQGRYQLLTKKPIIADRQEQLDNPRSRSAKLRVARKISKTLDS